MTVTTYNTPTDPYHIEKDITAVTGTYTGNARGAVSVDRPVIEVSGTEITGNYAHIDTFGRYYWIVDKTVLRTGLTQLSLRSDPLMSFSTQVKGLQILPDRCEQAAIETGQTGFHSMLIDKNQPFLTPITIQRKELVTFTWDTYYTLVTVG